MRILRGVGAVVACGLLVGPMAVSASAQPRSAGQNAVARLHDCSWCGFQPKINMSVRQWPRLENSPWVDDVEEWTIYPDYCWTDWGEGKWDKVSGKNQNVGFVPESNIAFWVGSPSPC
ncbi:hypothetical protein [Amycolatopsis sp. NPDC004079]|uniref:hypothetical protein n=1 Tax=Amycolatopsis sp. NPDC004079 TaxID=3154549 RepID=UPI00339DBC92